MTFPTKRLLPTAEHKAFRDDLIAVLRKHGHLPADEILALSAHLVGQIVAMQDQRKLTPAMAMQIVAANIEAGNQEVLAGLVSAAGGKA